MFPARNRSTGGTLCAPDVCVTPPGAPVPYVNLGLDATAVPFAVKTYLTGTNALNMGAVIPLTNGDQAGTMSPFMGPAMVTVGNPKVFVEGLPATNQVNPAIGNSGIASLGAVLMASITNVFLTYSNVDAIPPLGRAVEADAGMIAELSWALRGLPDGGDAPAEAVLPGGIVYARVPVFSLGLPGRVHDLVARHDPSALVLDLRGCPGGDLISAVELAGDFLPEGAVVATVTDEDGDDTVYRSRCERPSQLPLILLVDRETASAAEVLAGALQAHGRAIVAGERTLGKGTAQRLSPSPAGAAYATVGTITLPNGAPIDGIGITPDILLG